MDIFSDAPNNGKYGIEALTAGTNLANNLYDLTSKVYFDDNKIDFNDLGDVATIGPRVFSSANLFLGKFKDLGKEITDLSEAEKDQLKALAGARLKDPSYLKIHSGILDIIDGISEKTNSSNPVD